MSFVNEEVSDQDKSHPIFAKTNPFPPRDSIRPHWWTIDRRRDFVFMFIAGQDREIPDRFIYQDRGYLGAIMARETYSVVEPLKTGPGFLSDIIWTIEYLHIPIPLRESYEEIKSLVTEAFESFGHNYGKGAIRNTSVIWDRCKMTFGGDEYAKL